MNSTNFFQSKFFKGLIVGIISFIILLAVFQLGVFVGYRKANFSFSWGDNYHRTFGGPPGGFLRDFKGEDFISSHGGAGIIAIIDGNDLIVRDQNGVEKNFVVTQDTAIKRGIADLSLTDLKTDDRVVIIGSPQADGTIEAKIIRVFTVEDELPPPPFIRFNPR